MKKIVRFLATFLISMACAGIAVAQQPARVPRVGYMAAVSTTADAPRLEAFRQGLRELGYIERNRCRHPGVSVREYAYHSRKPGRLFQAGQSRNGIILNQDYRHGRPTEPMF